MRVDVFAARRIHHREVVGAYRPVEARLIDHAGLEVKVGAVEVVTELEDGAVGADGHGLHVAVPVHVGAQDDAAALGRVDDSYLEGWHDPYEVVGEGPALGGPGPPARGLTSS